MFFNNPNKSYVHFNHFVEILRSGTYRHLYERVGAFSNYKNKNTTRPNVKNRTVQIKREGTSPNAKKKSRIKFSPFSTPRPYLGPLCYSYRGTLHPDENSPEGFESDEPIGFNDSIFVRKREIVNVWQRSMNT